MFKWFMGRSRRQASTMREAPATAPMSTVDLQQARAAMENGARLVDVREQDEWDTGHVAGAVLQPLSGLTPGRVADIPFETPIVTYCKAGGRALRAAEILRSSGYTDVRAMRGGFPDWRAAGYPTE